VLKGVLLEVAGAIKQLVESWAAFAALWLAAAIAAAAGLPALAALGGPASSVDADRTQMKAGSVQVTQAAAYQVQAIHAPGGTVVKEYVSPAGRVFAVSWQGPFPPQMQQILGDYFEQYSQALEAQQKPYGHRPLNIQLPGFVIETGGHMRAYFGRAYVPGMLPQGVTADEIK
jgi:hypothetical protein